MKYYPINLNLKDKNCIVVGAGSVALRKVKRLLGCNAKVKVISPKVSPDLKKLAKNRKIVLKNKKVTENDLKNACLVISATEDRKINSFVSSFCKKKNILVNVVDSPNECTFILPSIVKQGDLIISISTGGISPALSKKIRKELEKRFGKEFGKFLEFMKSLRPKILKEIKNPKKRKVFFESKIRALFKKS